MHDTPISLCRRSPNSKACHTSSPLDHTQVNYPFLFLFGSKNVPRSSRDVIFAAERAGPRLRRGSKTPGVLLTGQRLSPARKRRQRARRTAQNLGVRAQWLENSAEAEVAAPLERCWELWEDQERIPAWMPWISSVKVIASLTPGTLPRLSDQATG
jgi:hypothetical protein